MKRKYVQQAINDYNIKIGQYNDTYIYSNFLVKQGKYWYIDYRIAGTTFEDRMTREVGRTLQDVYYTIKNWSRNS